MKAATTTHDVLLVLSAGNEARDASLNGLPTLRDSTYGADHVIVVGAADRTLERDSRSNTVPLVDLLAPGVDVSLLSGQSATATASGTSYSAPFVAGAAALLLGFDATMTAGDAKRYLLRGAEVAWKKPELRGIQNTDTVLDVYESLKLVARERSRPDLPPCGMFSLYSSDRTRVDLWALNDTAIPVRATLVRTFPIPAEILDLGRFRLGVGDLGHEYRTQLYVTHGQPPRPSRRESIYTVF